MKVQAGKENEWKKIQREWSKGDLNKAVVAFAQRWAKKMEKRFQGTFNHEFAEQAKQEEIGDLTNHMYCCAVGLLADVWIFGENLRQWHNIVRSNDLSYAIAANIRGEVVFF